MRLSIIIPVYNEKETITTVIERVLQTKIDIEKEIIIVDDGSTDGTTEILKKLYDERIKIHFSKKNFGKGTSVRIGLKHATGEIVLIQDADLEYGPEDYTFLITPILEGKEEVVYGSRLMKKQQEKGYLFNTFANKFLSLVTTVLYGVKITDMETGFKVFRKEIIDRIKLNGKRFEIEPEITAKILKKGFKIYEVPVNYYPRSVKQGKKIGWKDGLMAIWTLLKYRFL